MDDELRQALAALKQELKQEILDGVAEVVRDSQTEILKAPAGRSSHLCGVARITAEDARETRIE